ncbi:glycoside hydrolase family 15 protein [Lentisphaera profundi]|uniref:Glycoside hydrolase family 15 protein n=1 Tax=Lentisphaera profundi TaxID=1658616 RepID=A0ABY7VYP8_9BACT|nr:glycoside hydrolase family 15 protein [Lentisphaera profundi]WDE99031.1 glycoside hydrolase family 15 protein [Lentisphaera profundi]
MSTQKTESILEQFYQEVNQTILIRQDPLTGLFPASTDINEHGDYTDAWVRDNVYTIQAVWGLAMAYRKSSVNNARAYSLEQSVVKLMRGLLQAMIRQSHKVEKFKYSQDPLDALHAKYDTQSGQTVVGDDQWGHLQLDATSIFLLMIAQMTKSGLRIIYSHDEVDFVQNLVHYIGRAYRTPDFGIWERGHKINNGMAEVNASSVGMAKAALEAMDEMNLFGDDGDQSSLIHVMGDEIARSRSTLQALLPRESYSKEVDAAVLSIVGYPAFAIEDPELRERTRKEIVQKLGGRYGCKRFLLDGHQTVMEDEHRLHYETSELKNFKDIESEWPLFFTYLMLDALFRDDKNEAREYKEKLDSLLVEKDGLKLLPELYFVPNDAVDAEKETPHSQDRVPNNNLPLIWAQSLFLLGRMIEEKVLALSDLDPLNRHSQNLEEKPKNVQVCIISMSPSVQETLASKGIPSQTLDEIEPTKIMYPNELAEILFEMGANTKLELSGRPKRRLRAMATSRLYHINGKPALFLPQYQNHQDFYLELDNRILIEEAKSEFSYISRHWTSDGQAIQALFIKADMLEGEDAPDLYQFLQDMQSDQVPHANIVDFNTAVKNTPIKSIVNVPDLPSYCPTLNSNVKPTYYLDCCPSETIELSPTTMERLAQEPSEDELIEELNTTKNLYRQAKTLVYLAKKHSLAFSCFIQNKQEDVSLHILLEEVYQHACEQRIWAIVRSIAGLLNKSHFGLDDAVTELLVRQKIVIVGRSYNKDGIINQSMNNDDIIQKIKKSCGHDSREELIHQELLIFLSYVVKQDPTLFNNMISIRTSEFIHLIVAQIASELKISQGQAFDLLVAMPPQAIQTRLKTVLAAYKEMQNNMQSLEFINYTCETQETDFNKGSIDEEFQTRVANWATWRLQNGAISKLPKSFYPKLRKILENCKGIILGNKFNSSNCIDSSLVLSSMTTGEPAFAFLADNLLNDIPAADYRHLCIESLSAIGAFSIANPSLKFDDYIVLDVIIGHAVRLNWLHKYPAQAQHYQERKAQAWELIYQSSPQRVAASIIDAIKFLLTQ